MSTSKKKSAHNPYLHIPLISEIQKRPIIWDEKYLKNGYESVEQWGEIEKHFKKSREILQNEWEFLKARFKEEINYLKYYGSKYKPKWYLFDHMQFMKKNFVESLTYSAPPEEVTTFKKKYWLSLVEEVKEQPVVWDSTLYIDDVTLVDKTWVNIGKVIGKKTQELCLVCNSSEEPLFRFPEKWKSAAKWRKNLEKYIQNTHLNEYNMKICKNHFEEKCFENSVLKLNAVPTLEIGIIRYLSKHYNKRCSAKGCDSTNSISEMRFFKFPKDPQLLKQWVDILNVPKVKEYMVACMLHFDKQFWVHLRLPPDALPNKGVVKDYTKPLPVLKVGNEINGDSSDEEEIAGGEIPKNARTETSCQDDWLYLILKYRTYLQQYAKRLQLNSPFSEVFDKMDFIKPYLEPLISYSDTEDDITNITIKEEFEIKQEKEDTFYESPVIVKEEVIIKEEKKDISTVTITKEEVTFEEENTLENLQPTVVVKQEVIVEEEPSEDLVEVIEQPDEIILIYDDHVEENNTSEKSQESKNKRYSKPPNNGSEKSKERVRKNKNHPALIKEVEKRPVLWDTNHPLHKNRMAMTKSWDEIGDQLEQKYEEGRIQWYFLVTKYKRQLQAELFSKARNTECLNFFDPKLYQLMSFLKEQYTKEFKTTINSAVKRTASPKSPSFTYQIRVDDLSKTIKAKTDQRFKPIRPNLDRNPEFKQPIISRDPNVQERLYIEVIEAPNQGIPRTVPPPKIIKLSRDPIKDSDEEFLKSLLPYFKEMNEEQKKRIKTSIKYMVIKELKK
ncbi:hypothetical protein ACFFRR_003991 [Megaselia abdita]